MAYPFSFPLVSEPPTGICDEGQTPSDCAIRVEKDFSGASEPSDTYGDLAVVNIPLESTSASCGASVSVGLVKGCPAETIDLIWDDAQSPTAIARNTSEYIFIKHGYPPYLWSIESGHGFTLEYSETSSLRNTLFADGTACGTAQIKVVDECLTEIIGEVSCSQATDFAYNWSVSSETIVQGESGVTIGVSGGTGPYSWAVEGQGFTISQGSTVGLLNTISANWCSCGTANITVTDACGDEAIGSVRCTDSGEWTDWRTMSLDEPSPVFGLGTCPVQAQTLELTQGGYQLREYLERCTSTSICPAFDCLGPAYSPYSYLLPTGQSSYIKCSDVANAAGCTTFPPGWTAVGDCCYDGLYTRYLVDIRQIKEWVCPEDFEVTYDWSNSSETITTGSTVNIYVKGGNGPFTWAVLETGYTLGANETSGHANTLHAGPGLCGSVTVTIEDECGFQTSGSLRNTSDGEWVVIEDTALGDDACGIMRGVGRDYWYWGHAPFHGDSWRGKYWLREEYGRIGYGWPYPGWCDECKAATYGQGFESCLLGRIPTCKETYPWADPGAGPCCYCSHGFCHYMGRRKLYEWKCS